MKRTLYHIVTNPYTQDRAIAQAVIRWPLTM